MRYFLGMASPPKRRVLVALVSTLVAVALVSSAVLTVSAATNSAAPASTTLAPEPRSTTGPTATASPSPTATASPSPTATANPDSTANPGPVKVRKPKPASRTQKARNVPEFPRDTHYGRRIVYDKALMTVWVMGERDQVIGRYPVVGRFDRPVMGTYKIFSKSKVAYNPNSKVTFNHMMRFTYGPDTKSPIGLHAIPRYYDGTEMHSVKQLGLAIAAGGCVRLSEEAAAAIYKWAKVGDRVIVLPSP